MGSIPVRVTTSEQSPLRSKSGSSFRVAGFFVCAPLLLLFQIGSALLGFDLAPCQSTEGGRIYFAYFPRDSKGAAVNDVPGARQSRDPARPQARSPVRVTTSEQSPLRSKSGSSYRVAGFFVCAPLLLLSKSNPLCWASIWLLASPPKVG